MTILIVLSITAAIAIAFAGMIVLVEYPRSAVDQTRNELFDLRSQLFEVAHSGKVSFEHRGYGTARDLLNGMIRYAHDVSATHLLFSNLFANREARIIRQVVNKAIRSDLNSLPKAAKEDVERILANASVALARLIVFRSVTFSCIFAAYVAAHGLFEVFKVLVAGVRTFFHSPRDIIAPQKAHANNVEESMHEVMDHSPMKKVPRLIVREATRYTRKYDMQMYPVATAA